ncbi:MAG: hypothetical protein JXA67_07570 [Micromonosporaceae bacterium]|nr:hypothetical protein [Micromonosporaceae bacterium]
MKRTVLAVAVATVLAIVGCAMLLIYIRAADNRAVAGKEPTRVLVATKRIPAGTTGAEIKTGSYVEVVTMPKTSVPADVLSSIDESLEELVVNADVQKRQLILRGAFGQATDLSGGLQIPEGKVAVSIPIVTTAGMKYVSPGSRIALYDTFTMREDKGMIPGGDDFKREYLLTHATRLLLPKAEVIAVGIPGQAGARTSSTGSGTSVVESESDGGESEAKIEEMTVVTLALTQSEAERTILAAETGRLYIVLLDDTSDLKPGPGVNYDSLFN